MHTSLDKVVIEFFSKRKDVYLPLLSKDPFFDRIILYFRDKGSFSGDFLELGTGSGRLLEHIVRNNPEVRVHGVDFCKELVNEGRERYSRKINFLVADSRHLPFKDESFQNIACRAMFHHMVSGSTRQNVMLALREAARVLKRNGVVFIDEECLHYRFQSRILFFVTYLLAKLNINIPYFNLPPKIVVSYLTPRELRVLLYNAGFKLSEWVEEVWNMRLRYKLTLLVTKVFYVHLTAVKRGSETIKT